MNSFHVSVISCLLPLWYILSPVNIIIGFVKNTIEIACVFLGLKVLEIHFPEHLILQNNYHQLKLITMGFGFPIVTPTGTRAGNQIKGKMLYNMCTSELDSLASRRSRITFDSIFDLAFNSTLILSLIFLKSLL